MAQPTPEQQLDGMIISDTSIKQPVFITMLMLLAIVIGLLAYSVLPVNLFPDFQIPVVTVTVPYPGAGPESVADQVAKPIEDTINTINGVRHITSNSSEGIAQIIVEFNNNINVDRAEQDVREKVNAILPQLPRDVRDPVFLKIDLNDSPILTMAVASDGSLSPLQLREIVDDDITPQLQQVEGVGSVDVSGGQQRQINVWMDLEKLKAWQILPVQITNAIRNANTNLGLGSITQGTQDISLRAPSQLQTPEDITRVQITGTPYRVGDVATIEEGVAEIDTYARLDGKDAISISIRKQSGTNTLAVADSVKEQLTDIFKAYPNLTYFIPIDQSVFVRNSTNSAIEELIIASVAAMLVVLLFFRDLRNTLVTVAGLPVIMIATFAAMQAFGQSINLVSLLALSLSVGLVIDDAIVVRENVFRHMERGEMPMIASSRGTAQVSLSVLAMTLTIIAVFLPVAFTSGITGVIFKAFGITVAAAMAISLIEAFTLAPMMSAHLFKQKQGVKRQIHAEKLTDAQELMEEANENHGRLARWYERLLYSSLRRRWSVVVITVVVLAFSIYIASGLKFAFFPAQDTGEFSMSFIMPPGTTLDETDRLARETEAILLADPAVEALQTTVGSSSGLASVSGSENADFFVKLHGDEPTSEVQARLREKLAPLNLPKLAFGQPDFGGSGTGVTSRQIQVSVQSPRPVEEFIPLLQQYQGAAGQIQGLVDIDSTYNPGRPEVRFIADPTKIGAIGITNDDIASSVRALVNGDIATVFRKDGQDTDVVVRLRPGDRTSVESIQNISVPTRSGNVPLSALGRVEIASSPTTVRRYDRQNQVLIGANVVGRNLNDVQQEINAGLSQIQTPENVTVSFQGSTQDQQEGFETLFIAMGLSILFVYMVLASQFGSFLQPLVIMMAMPFSFLGAFLALRLTNIELDIVGMIGLIMLLGLVTKNSILLVDFTNKLRRAGMEKNRAIELAGAVRLRPILMTTAALVAGALPTAFGFHIFGGGEGSEFRKGLAIVLIGGLVTSTLLTLFVVPVAYSYLESLSRVTSNLFRREARLEPALAFAAAGAHGNGAAPVAPTDRTNSAPHTHIDGYHMTDTSGNSPSASDERTEPQEPTGDTRKV
jgi:HAE1 family hydrophobic/amphiphilic exporter-1